MRCNKCNSTGEYLGTGMMLVECDLCNAPEEEVSVIKAPAVEKIDRTTASYKEAINSIMKMHPKMKRSDAIKLFDKTYKEV